MAGQIRFFNGEIVAWERLRQTPPDAHIQSLLLQSHQLRRYPVCLCRSPHPPLYVRRAPTGLLHLSRMPGTMHQHAPDCLLFQEQQGYPPANGQQRGTPLFPLGTGQPLWQTPALTWPAGTAMPSQKTGGHTRALSLPGLLQMLWHQAGLDRLTPADAGTRSWPLLYPRLLAAARNILVLAGTLEDLLFLPQPYVESRKAGIDQENTRRFAYFQERGQHMLVAGQIRKVQSGADGQSPNAHKLFLHHLHIPLRLASPATEVFFTQLDKFSSLLENSTETDRDGQMVTVRQTSNQRDRILCLLTVEVVRWKSVYLLKVQDSWLMRTHASYIPVNSAYESMVASELIRTERSFIKPLQYDAGEAANVADFILLDGASEIPMEIYGYRRLPMYDQVRLARIERYRTNGTPFWAWDVAQNRRQWPPLPQPA